MYDHKKIEKKWQNHWFKNNTFQTTNKYLKKYYVLDMFPYPSGSGLHVGHLLGYTATDIIARYKRLKEYDVLHPIGWDAFGLPAEQYALKTHNHPEKFTLKNIDNFRRQLKNMGFSFDYDKEINTIDPNFYKQTQWIFSEFYKNKLAILKDIEVNWCEKLGTVLANEEVLTLADGKKVSERGSFLVTKKFMKQWVLKITDYADKLFEDLKEVNWSSSLISLQKNWIKNKDGSLHLRDWIFSRQRYWGEPFPIYFDENNNVFLEMNLPVLLPYMKHISISGNGESPLANNKEWVYFQKNNQTFKRETNTMPQWAGSSWYYLAYILKNKDGTYLDLKSKEAKKRFEKWLPVDLYVGGQEHAVLHLLYARFWHKFLYDLKIVSNKEPFYKVINQGMILDKNNQKMSKSKGNVVNPDDIINEYGADTLRLYQMFMGSLEDNKVWSIKGIKGMRKWIERVKFIIEAAIDKNNDFFIIDFNIDCPLINYYHDFVKKITIDIELLKFNVAISKMMVFINLLYKIKKSQSLISLKGFLIILSIFAPHVSEELLNKMNELEILNQKWPKYNFKKIFNSNIKIIIQINGKLKFILKLQKKFSKSEIINMAKKNIKIISHLKNKKIIKEIYVENKILNFVIK